MKSGEPVAEGGGGEPAEEAIWHRYYRYAYNVCWTLATALSVLGLPLFIAIRM
jgi:hypothetical protein